MRWSSTSIAASGSSTSWGGWAATACAVSRRRSEPPTRRHSSLHRDVLGALLGQEAAQRLVESLAPWPAASSAPSGWLAREPARPLDRLRQVRGARAERVGEVVADDRGHAPRPEQQADDQADRAADRDVLDPQHADLPARPGRSRLNSTATVTVNAAWPTANGAVPGRVGGDEHRDRQHHPERRSTSLPIAEQQRARRSRTRPPCRAAPAARSTPVEAALVRSTDSVPEHHPESVLDAAQIGHRDGGRQRQRPAQAVDEPDRAQARVAARDAGDLETGLGDALRRAARTRAIRTSRCAPRRSSRRPRAARRRAASAPIARHRDRDRVRVERELRLLAEVGRRPAAAACSRPMLCVRGILEALEVGPGCAPGEQRAGVAQHLQQRPRAARARSPAPRRADRRARGRCRRSATCTTRAARPRWPAPGRSVREAGRPERRRREQRDQLVLGVDAAVQLLLGRVAAHASRRARRRARRRASRPRRAAGHRRPAATSRAPQRCRPPTPATTRRAGRGPCETSRATPPAARRRAAPRSRPTAALGRAIAARRTPRTSPARSRSRRAPPTS